MTDGAHVSHRYDPLMASYAQKHTRSLGRTYPEAADPHRTPAQRDRDRIIHSNAFRRLKGKMQVLPPHAGDHFRTRLTHTIEVASIARDIARQMRLNEDLAEAIALSHDLGHPPFGHSGERALQQCLSEYNLAFEHNEQSLRIVTQFERPYAAFPGLNLTHETLTGLRKHDDQIPYLEAQMTDIADEIAYLAADLEDGLRGNFFAYNELERLPLVMVALNGRPFPQDPNSRRFVIRKVIGYLIRSLIVASEERILNHRIILPEDVARCPVRLVAFDRRTEAMFLDVKSFLRLRFYQHPVVQGFTEKGEEVIKTLFDHYVTDPTSVPEKPGSGGLVRRVADHIAGMTDAYATAIAQGLE